MIPRRYGFGRLAANVIAGSPSFILKCSHFLTLLYFENELVPGKQQKRDSTRNHLKTQQVALM
jgi:hypothetical protein